METISEAVKACLRKNPDAALQEIMSHLSELGYTQEEMNAHFKLNKSAKPPVQEDLEQMSAPELDDVWDLPDDVKNDL